MALSHNRGPFGRQQEIFDPFCQPQHLNFPRNPSPWDTHALLPPLPLFPPSALGFSARNRIEYDETPDTHFFRVQLQGNEDVKVCVEDGRVLHISARGAGKREERQDERGYYKMESSCGEFASKFTLPDDAKVELLRSFVKDGMLMVTVPREKSRLTNGLYPKRAY